MGYITPTLPTVTPATESELIDKVKMRMDEIDHAASSIVDVGVIDNKPITSMIETLLNESLLNVLSKAPLQLLPKVKYVVPSTSLTERSDVNGVEVVLPDDALRVVAFRYEDWMRDVVTLSEPNSRDMSRQKYEFARAKNNTPKVVAIDGTTMLAFPYNGVEDEHGILIFGDFTVTYVSSATQYSDLNDKMIDALCWDCAGKVFTAIGMADNAAKSFDIYAMLIK